MSILVFDLETNGLLREVSKVHCGAIIDVQTKEEFFYDPSGIEELLGKLKDSSCLIGHNVVGYDLRVLEKLYGFKYEGAVFDTYVLSRLLNPEGRDHSLEAWGSRLKEPKGVYTGGWEEYNPEMKKYNIQDTRVNLKLFWYFVEKLKWGELIKEYSNAA